MLHESNTFSSVPTDLDAFMRTQYLLGQELVTYHQGKRTEPGGMIDVLRKSNVDIIPTLSAWAIPSGVVTRRAYREIKKQITDPIKKYAAELDGVLLALHGAMIVEGLEDPEGDLIEEVRRIVKDGCYIGVSLDMHAHLTNNMVNNADFFTAYRTHPHVDQYETGAKTAEIMLKAVENSVKFAKSYLWIPLMAPGENRDETREQLASESRDIEKDPTVVSSLFIISHPWSDITIQGDSVLVITDNDENLARSYARRFAKKYWDLRYDFPLDLFSMQQAAKIGLETKAGGPTVICEMGDCLLGGASGDVMTTVSYLMQRGARDVAVAVVVDPESVETAIRSGKGGKVRMNVGGKIYTEKNPPLYFEGTVKFCGEDVEGQDNILVGYETKMGRMVVVEGNGVELVIVEKPGKIGGPSFLRAVGIEPEEKQFIVLKDSIGPLISYKDIARHILLVDTPGWCDHKLATITYTKVPRPIFPLDPILSWNPY